MKITLGSQHISGKFLKDGSVKQVKENMVYVPILKTLQRLLSNDTVIAEVSISLYYKCACMHSTKID